MMEALSHGKHVYSHQRAYKLRSIILRCHPGLYTMQESLYLDEIVQYQSGLEWS